MGKPLTIYRCQLYPVTFKLIVLISRRPCYFGNQLNVIGAISIYDAISVFLGLKLAPFISNSICREIVLDHVRI